MTDATLSADPVLAGCRKRNDEYREHSIINSAIDAADRAYLIDLIDSRDARIAALERDLSRANELIASTMAKLVKSTNEATEWKKSFDALMRRPAPEPASVTAEKRLCTRCNGDPIGSDGSICPECEGDCMVEYKATDDKGVAELARSWNELLKLSKNVSDEDWQRLTKARGSFEPKDLSPDAIADHLRSILADGTNMCPLCGETLIHEHTPREIVIYRNGVKYGRSLSHETTKTQSEEMPAMEWPEDPMFDCMTPGCNRRVNTDGSYCALCELDNDAHAEWERDRD